VSIRWKLILAIGVPLVGMLAGILWLDHARARDWAISREQGELAADAVRAASALDGHLREISQMATSTAWALSSGSSLTREELFRLLEHNVASNPAIYGSCLAFEPGAAPESEQARELFAPYVWRPEPGGPQTGAPAGVPFWTEPFFDEGAGDVQMVTYSAPFTREGRFAGVATVDVHLEELRDRVRATVRSSREVWLLSRRGVVIIAPVALARPGESVREVAQRLDRPMVLELARRMTLGSEGTAIIGGTHGEDRLVAFFAPVASTGWSLCGVRSEREVLAPVYAQLRLRTGLGLAFIVLVLAVVLAMGVWIVGPVRRLAAAVEQVASGDLEARVTGVISSDEIGRLAGTFNDMVSQLRDHMDARARDAAQRQRLQAELHLARDIQAAFLPKRFPSDSRYDLFAASVPARTVGGDFFDFLRTEDDVLILVVGDISGKGVPAAIFMAAARTMLRDLLGAGLQPADALNLANRTLARDNDTGMFLTVVIARIDLRRGEVVYANAGHPPPLVVEGGRARPIGPPTGTILGILEDAVFTQRSARLAPGATLLAYTDGATEARSPEGQFLGEERFVGLVVEAEHADGRRVVEDILARVDLFQAGERADDLTILYFRAQMPPRPAGRTPEAGTTAAQMPVA
jgi:sigma-B regulation protein RsbU (phosphoserine phosphatase)